jgi:hypothetical protein
MGVGVTGPTDDFVQTFQIEGMNVRGSRTGCCKRMAIPTPCRR